MADEPSSPPLDVGTPLYLRDLWSGDALAVAVADPDLATFGDEATVLADAELFLEHHLSQAPPERVARFALSPETALRDIDVTLRRDDLPKAFRRELTIAISCAVIPTHSGDRWVLVVPLAHTLFVGAGEDLDAAVRSEVQRMAPLQLEPWAYLRLFPARTHELRWLRVELAREIGPGAARTAALRRARAEQEKRKQAARVLESVAVPIHRQLARGPRPPVVARDAELDVLAPLLASKDRTSVLVVGPELVGKSALVRAWLGAELDAGRERFVYATSAAQLIAGQSCLGQWQERLRRTMEAAEALDAIVYFERFADLLAERGEGGVDLGSAIKPYIDRGRVRVVGELTHEALDLLETRHAGLLSAMTRVRIDPLDAERTAQVVSRRIAFAAEHERERPNLRPEAIPQLLDVLERYVPYRSFPGKAIRLYEEIRSAVEQRRDQAGRGAELGADDVLDVFGVLTGIPPFLLREDRPLHAEEVERQLRRSLVGQESAVRGVVETICVVKAGLQPSGKPLATFLFAGPTGVGKTELARALATFLFGAADRMVRFDMSEYADPFAADRLIRGSDRSEGLLTRQIRRQPFSILLLDEIEKAHASVFDLLLQVCGEGRLTDARGKTAFFHNTIIIMTSNLGASRRAPIALGPAAEGPESADAHYVQEVRRAFRPEFVNRLDRIIPFRPLTRDQIRDVARIALSRIAQRRGLLEIGLSLDVDDEALDALAREGFSDRYGARALRRHIEDRLIAPTSELLARNAWRAKGAVLRATVQPGGSALGLELVPGVAGPGGAMSSVRAEVSLRRREANQLFALERVDQVRDRIGFVLSQLNYGRFGKARTDKRVTIELNELSIEYHRLTKVLEAADAPRRDLETLEDMAIVSLFAGEDSPELRDEARERHERFEDRFVYVLIVLDPHPNEITLLLQADETRRVLDDWLVPFLAHASRERGWQTTLHVWDPKRSWPRRDDWPGDRSWSPPESAEVFLRRRERGAEALPRDVLLRVRGPYAGILLSLEAGIHRRTVEHEGKVAHHHMICTRVAMRTTLGDQEWTSEEIAPLAPLPKREELALMDAVREYADKTRLLFVSSKRASLSIDPDPSEYWRNFERIALKHLLLYEDERLRLDREELWKGKLGAVPASDAPEAAR